jgi:hypothetical protein
MKIYRCSNCGQVVFFDNSACTQCGAALVYLPDLQMMSAVVPLRGERDTLASGPLLRASVPGAEGQRYRLCANGREHGVCNWAVPATESDPLCAACRFNRVIPDLSDAGRKEAWARLERQKRRLLYTLYALRLPLRPKSADPERGLAFAFMADDPSGAPKVYTGHRDGLITINIAEADDPYREQTRKEMGEAYRTLLGHFRHESGHYYWDRLIRDSPLLPAFRARFGDETRDYATCAERHYARGAPKDWRRSYVSPYASMHPWEDWAETWAHYLHIVDTLETARSYDLVLRPKPVGSPPERAVAAGTVHTEKFDEIIQAWLPLTVALNSLNRSMGLPDLYPFVLSDRAIEKLRFVHDVIEQAPASA